MAIAGIIVAGGGSRRMGTSKPDLRFGDGRLLDAMIARLTPQVDRLALNLRDARTEACLPVLDDAVPGGVGPLAGVLAGLEWARRFGDVEWLASAPGDTPFLPHDLVAQLRAGATAGTPIYAQERARDQFLCALWPPECAALLRAGVENGRLRSLKDAFAELGGRPCPIEAAPHAFLNINTPDDLAEARRIATAQRARGG